MSKLDLFIKNTDISAGDTWTSGVHRLLPFHEVMMNVRNGSHKSKIHFDQGTTPTEAADPTTRYRQTREVHSGVHQHNKFHVHMEYGRMQYEELSGADTSGLLLDAYANQEASDKVVSMHRTIYDNVNVNNGQSSEVMDVEHYRNFDVLGSSSAATTIVPYISADASFYVPHTDNIVLSGAGFYHAQLTTTARWLRFDNSGADVSMSLYVTAQN